MTEWHSAPEDVARQLLAHITRETQHPEKLADVAATAYRRLRERLGMLLGQAGFDALWARASHEVSHEAHSQNDSGSGRTADTAVQMLHSLVDGRDLVAARDRLVAVFGACIRLLYTFIGEDISFRVIQQIWPEVPLGKLGASNEEATP